MPALDLAVPARPARILSWSLLRNGAAVRGSALGTTVLDGAADRRCLVRLSLFLLAVYLLTMAGRVISGDGETVYLTTKALATRLTLAIEPRPETAQGTDGQWYGKYGLGQSLAQLPFFVIGHVAGKAFGAADDRPARFAVGATNAFVTTAEVGLFWLVLRALNTGRGPATAAALVFGLATLAWPYARADFAEPLQATTLLLAFYAAIRWRRRPRVGWAALTGAGAGMALLTKIASAVLLLPLGLYFLVALWQWRQHRSRLITHVIAAGLPLALALIAQAGLNYARFGSVAEMGYGDEPATGFTTPLLEGVGYLLLSPGKGLLFFAPPVVAGAVGLVWLGRRQPLEAGTAGLIFLAELLYFGRWWAWHGDWSWGPRYLVVTVPFLMLGWGAVGTAWRLSPLVLRGINGLLVAAGFGIALLGVVVDYGAYYSVVGDQLARGMDVRHARHVPEFSPILGHAWLARASLYETALDLAGRKGTSHGKATSNGKGTSDEPLAESENPYRWDYPWRETYPEARPEAPDRAFGFDLWFVVRRDQTDFVRYWAALSATWLAVATVAAGGPLWRAARSPVQPPAASSPLLRAARRTVREGHATMPARADATPAAPLGR
ncbi:MAG: phospholipid carrier-dependent glycosyltransferase [Chloroflexota bacterium]|nr:phospholipid carrier-dependent glycosyltransferase [Chloroflexota bacterium]